MGKVHLREKLLKNGDFSYYIEWYNKYTHKSEKRYLGLYRRIGTTPEIKKQNRDDKLRANIFRNEIENELTSGKVCFLPKKQETKLLSIWIDECIKSKRITSKSDSREETFRNLKKHLKLFKKNFDSLLVSNIDKTFCEEFISYLTKATSLNAKNNPKILSRSTARLYFSALGSILQEAEREGIIDRNPIEKVSLSSKKNIKQKKKQRAFLTNEELSMLDSTPAGNEETKRAFLFACCCGLRISDIRELRWMDIKVVNKNTYIIKTMVKTEEIIKIPLPKIATHYLPERGDAKLTDNIFHLTTQYAINSCLRTWAKRAGIDKHLTFHVSRHTFATLLLSLGADIYTTSKLLGHQDVKTTQIYADIIDKKREDAMNLLNSI